MNFSTIGTGLGIALYYHWQLTLIVLGLSPLIMLSSALNVKRMRSFARESE
jgi:hypothetical protein